VNLVPGRDGLVHISKLGRGRRLSNVEEAVREGDRLEVEIQDIDAMGKISLSPVGEEWQAPNGAQDEQPRERRPRREGERRPRRDRDRRPRRDGGRADDGQG
jgi:polyribonucleotide nucleotidyltransferase